MSKTVQKDYFFSYGSNDADKNEFVFQFTCLQPHLYVKIHTPRTHISSFEPFECIELFVP